MGLRAEPGASRSAPSAREPTYWMLESRPWVMTPVNLVVLLVSTSIHWV